jgi:hypothetical protein
VFNGRLKLVYTDSRSARLSNTASIPRQRTGRD